MVWVKSHMSVYKMVQNILKVKGIRWQIIKNEGNMSSITHPMDCCKLTGVVVNSRNVTCDLSLLYAHM